MHMIEESMTCVQGFHTFTSLCVGAVVSQSSHRVLTSGIHVHAVRGLQGGRCGMDYYSGCVQGGGCDKDILECVHWVVCTRQMGDKGSVKRSVWAGDSVSA